ncbi:protocadherin Fat 3-like [Myxocyprinus asiaticus]|uniref:protocadherin Fat 3-like n=1 Tax=Myxocyprinus asiaticus TaxID=70543 RepID=UPI0022220482|nr:protocadherin Fat 3-like [Myxocyprinus asiaticus]
MAINGCPGGSMRILLTSFFLFLLHLVPCWGQQQEPGSSFFQFTSSMYNATIYENSAARTYIRSEVKMGITLSKLGSWDIKYSIESGDDEGLFQAEEFVLGDFCFLRIRTNGGSAAILNREVQDNYTLTVRATGKGGLKTSVRVSVLVMDMNDLRPLFSPTSYSISVPESTPLGVSVAQVTATDADIGSNGEFYYFFREDVEEFAVHPTSGVISLTGRPNADKTSRFDLEVLAVDRGMKVYGNNGISSTAKLVITVLRINEYAPTLTVVALFPSISEKEAVYAVVTVEDLDEGLNGEIEWVEIIAGDPQEQFVLDRAPLGNEYKLKMSELDNWDKIPFGCNLTFQARDRGTPPKLSNPQTIQLLVKKPHSVQVSFEKELYKATFNEIAPPGSIIETVRISPRPPTVSYSLSLTSDSIYFIINPLTGVISTAQLFTSLNQELFELEVIETVSGMTAKVQITVEDANDNTPIFTSTSYEVFINESVSVGTVILTVMAVDDDKDENGCITYSIASLQPLPFIINQSTGELRTSMELDFESSLETYTFAVRASDWGSPYRRESEVNVTVKVLNINDNQPVFERVLCKGIIGQDFPVGQTIITMSAIDIDELGLVNYKILSGNEQDVFHLNPDSGMLSLRRPLTGMSIKKDQFSLKIAASDGELLSEPTFVNISLERGRTLPRSFSCQDTKVAQKLAEKLLKKASAVSKSKVEEGYTDLFSVNRQAPQFESFPSDIVVREDIPVGASVLQVNTNDGDTGFNGRVLHAISDGNIDESFNIDLESGLIYIYQPLNREKSDRYLLNITVYDLGLPQRSSWRLLTVNIDDVNDNSPKFSRESYTAVVPENAPVGTEVIKVTALDDDLGQNGEISYTLLTNTPLFTINSETGSVYVSSQLDRESISDITLKIQARDKAERGNQMFSETTLRVYLEDVNDCAPTFIPKSYSCRLLEDLPVGTVIAWMQTQDPDIGSGGWVRYSLPNDFNGTFKIQAESGAIKVAKDLDYEKQQFYNLSVVAEDLGFPVKLRSESYLEVEVIDVNENLNEPYFTEFAVRGTVKENCHHGTNVLQVTSMDNDKGKDGVIRYSIKARSGLERFAIDEETGMIYTTGTLNCETEDSYWLTVYATDRGVVPLTASIEVFIQVEDVNDNAPLTSEPVYHPYIMENSPKDVSVVRIQAQDPDVTASVSRLVYRITAGNPQNFFAIDSNTGLITTTSRKLDREQQAEHFLEVTVMDGGGIFRQSSVWVIVHVLDENDNKPEFTESVYRISLTERDRNKRGDPVYRVFANDRDEGSNADLTYSIVDGNDDGKFFIDAKTAMVSSRKMVTSGGYDILTIKAVDNGTPQRWSTARLHVEWIQKPMLSPQTLRFTAAVYNFTVAENAKVYEAVGVVSVWQAETPLWFDIIGGRTSREMFYIPQSTCGGNCSSDTGSNDGPFDKQRGIGTIVIARPLDAETQSIYNMTVQVTDGTNTATTQIYIKVLDSNDNAPVFSEHTYEVLVSEDTPADTEVVRVRARDRDERAKLSYSIHGSVDPASMRMFRINPGTGVMYTADRLDYETSTQHILTVMVKDQEFPYYRDLARIIVSLEDANDHPPFFTETVYDSMVFESAPLGTSALQVIALDRDSGRNGEIIYSVEAGNTGGLFGIDPLSGIISVVRELDLTTVGFYTLTVRATDGGTPALSTTTTARIIISLSDLSSPKFNQRDYQAEITENVAVGTFVIMISAISQSMLRYDIIQGNSERKFKINHFTGIITTQRDFDFEITSSYMLLIQAVNMAGIVSRVNVSIQVVDENDNPPVFQKLTYSGTISEAAPINSVIMSEDGSPLVIQATDADKNQNALLVFQIEEDTAKLFFTVDSGTGSVRTIAKLDYETFSTFYFSVNVRDSGMPQLMAEKPAKILIRVVNINDSPPQFSQEAYDTVLLLPTYIGVEALRVEATDPDMTTDLTYSLADSNLEHFEMDHSSGILTVKNNKLSKDCYRFNIKVSDGRYFCMALVTIRVREAMDSGLLFSQTFYFSSVLENSVNITTVSIVNAVGNRLNEPLKYTLLNAGTCFTIRPTSGVIQTTGVPFDREQQELYELVVEASREYDHLRVARVTVRVEVEDVNDNAPEFVGLPYYAVVQVDAEPGSFIFQVSATDLDKGINGAVYYELKEDHPHFELNKLTGELTLKRMFDADLSNVEYPLIVLARDAGYPSLFTTVDLPVTVVNKAMPVFDKPFYGISVREDIAVSTPILSINATSPEGQNIIYTIVDGDPLVQFDIGFDSGVISIIYALDYETTPYYRLTVRSTDTLTGARSEVDVDIVVVDVNDNAPVFRNASYTTTLAENSMIGTSVIQLMATDRDSEKNNVISYEILSDVFNSTDYFHIDSKSALVLTARLLDYKLAQFYSFIVRATDSGSPAQSSEVTVTVLLNDMNDNPPSFTQPLYEAFVSELAPRGHIVTCVQASDADSSDAERLRYGILSGDEKMNFIMNSQTGVISLSSQRRLGMQKAYSLNVSVSDGVFINTAQVNIQVLGANLYSPVFSQRFYLGEVQENAPAGTRVLQVRATDEDSGIFGQIMYSFINDLGKTQFNIGADGQITTAQKLDRENPVNRDIVLTVMALDGGGRASFCTVRVILADENDNVPCFRAVEYRVSIKANVPMGSLVTQIQAQDPDAGDNGRVSYSLYSEARLPLVDVLEIEPDNGWMVTKGSIAHLRGTVLSFFVKATDGGVPAKHSLVSAFIHVLPPDANVPSFTQPQYSYTIPEDTPVGTAFGSVYLSPGQTASFVMVNGETVESNQGGTFLVDKETGLLRLVNPLDYELVNIYRFKVSATMRQALVESMSVVDVEVKVLDVNDNKPSFETSSYVAMVMEGMPRDTRVIQVRALDPDWGSNGQVTYSLGPTLNQEQEKASRSKSVASAMFVIDSKTGWITTLGDLDHELCPSYTFSVVASDLGEGVSLSSTAVVTVSVADVNDNPPTFEREYYRGAVRENDPLGEVVSVLSTRDRDSSDQNRLVSFHITDGNSKGVFALAPVQGEWKVFVKQPLDREEQDRYLLNITASDGLFVTRIGVEVTVMDANDNSPICNQAQYEASFPEDVAINTAVLTVGATDLDTGVNAEIQYSLFGIGIEDFYMDANTGELKTASLLDREQTAGYKLIAQATDGGGLFCRSEISLTILDVNDNAPSFAFTRFMASVYESAAPKALLTRLQANDPDEGVNRKIVYSLVDSASGVFSIDPSSGVVILERSLDREVQDSYQIRIKAADRAGASGSLFTQVDLTIMVLDVNDNPPVFQKQDYSVTVPEDVAVGTEVLRVFATSDDIGVNAEIYYRFLSGNELGKFSIDDSTGTISVADDLDYELCKDFFLNVEAFDGGTPPLRTTTIVTIELLDVNDNSPSFSEEIYNVLISEDVAIGETVTRLFAEDLDSQVNGRITYSILKGDRKNQFCIDPVTGLLKVNKALDRETVSSYSLSVQAFDSGSPAKSTTVNVNIEIGDVNDNPPIFSPANASAVIQLNKPAGTTILTLSVSDKDSPRNGAPFEFRIVSGNDGNAFSLDQNGELRSNRVLGPDATREYMLEIQVHDSGKPRLSSTSFVFVRVIGDSLFKPVAFPLEINIVMAADVFPGGIIGKISATDRDENDVLSFSQRPQTKSLFKINRQDGKIVALNGLEPGRYSLNATVSDGRFSVMVGVTIQVEQVTEEMIQNAVTLRFQDISPEDFVGLYMQDMKTVLRGTLVTDGAGVTEGPDLLHILGVQPLSRSSQLEVLLAVEAPDGGYVGPGELALKFEEAKFLLGQALRVVSVLDQSCSGELECGERVCELALILDPIGVVTYTTSRVSFVSPRFSRKETCTCPGGICPSSLELCDGQTCPSDMQCVRSGPTAPSLCQCLPGTQDQCAGQTSLSFTGNSYIKYRVTDGNKSGDMRLGLRIRTLQSQGVIMYTRADSCTMLKIEEGHLWFQMDCDNTLDILGISGRPINDGSWHTVTLELTSNYTLLSLDDSYVERRRSARAPVLLWPLAADGSLFFGAQVLRGPVGSGGQRPPRVQEGFQGCLGAVILNGNELPLQNKRSRYAEVAGLSDVKLGCVLYPDPCLGGPCQNGASCTQLPSGDFSCSCLPQFTGSRCEMEVTSCVPSPCQNGGDCKAVGNSFLCGCLKGFTGLTCDEDVNECEREECENGGLCVNTFGAFYCNCTIGFEGQFCGQPSLDGLDTLPESLSYVGPGEIIGIGVLLFVVLVLLTLLAAFRKKVLQKDWSRGEAVGISTETNYMLQKTGVGAEGIEFKAVRVRGDCQASLYRNDSTGGPPQVMVRPTAYTLPHGQGIPRGETEKAEVEGGLATLSCPPQMSTFQADPPHILGMPRRGVAVCSVAPNLPTSMSPNPCERSPVCKPPWEEEEDDEEDEEEDNSTEHQVQASQWEDRCYRADREEVYRTEGNKNVVEEVACFSDSSTSEAHSLRSFQSDSCANNSSIMTVIQLVNNTVDTTENEVKGLGDVQPHSTTSSPHLRREDEICVEFVKEYFMNSYQLQATEWLHDTRLPGLESPPRDRTPTPPPPPLPAPPPPLTFTPTRLGGSVRLDGSTLSLQTGYPLRRYQGQRDFCSSLTQDDNNSPVYEEYHDPGHFANLPTVHPPGVSFCEGQSKPDYHHSSQYLLSHPPLLAWEERPQVWEDTHPFGSQQETIRLGRFSLQAHRLRDQSPKTSLSGMRDYY